METLKAKRNIHIFYGEKYSVWKFRIRSLLTELDVIKVIDETIPAELTDEWNKAERIAKSVIVEYLSDSFLGFATSENTARDILTSLDVLYERKSVASQLALRKKLLSLKLQGDTPLIKHFTLFEDLITELVAAGAKLEETDKVSHLLLTLPTSYDGVITAIETLSEDNLTLAFVKTRLLDHEVKLKNESSDTSAKVLQADCRDETLNKSNFGVPKKNFRKDNYKMHTSKFSGRSQKTNIKCHHCGRKGHIKKNCYYYKKGMQYKSAERRRTIQTVQVTQPSNNENSGFAFMVGDYQYENMDNTITFVLDSGASDHLVNRDDVFTSFTDLNNPLKISIAKNETFISATKKGTINVTSNMGIQGVLEDVLYCPDVPHNLLSVRRMQQAGMTIIFNQKGVEVTKGGKTVMKGKPLNNLIIVDFTIKRNMLNSIVHVNSIVNNNYKLWHERLGHIGKSKFLELKSNRMIEDIAQIDQVMPNDDLCEACINGKQTRLPFARVKTKSHIKRPLFIVHSDVCGPISPSTINNKSYFVIFIDDYTHYCVTYLITYKSDVFAVFQDYVAKSEAHFNLKIVNLYCDNGGEYLSTEIKNFCMQKGISYHLTVPRTPQLNGVSERMIRTISEKARAMINGADLEKVFWGEAVLTATYLINLSPTKALKQIKTPYELWHNKKPKLKYLKVFGSTVFIHNKTRKSKFDEKSFKGILVGYEPNGYKVWNVESEKFVTVRDVIVDETNFLKSRPVVKPEGVNVENPRNETDASDVQSKSVVKSQKYEHNKTNLVEPSSNKNVKLGHEPNESVVETDVHKKCLSPDKSQTPIPSEPRRSDRIKCRETISYNEDNNILDDYLLCAQSIVHKVPTSYQEIQNRDDRLQWEQAIKDEIDSLLINNTWSLVPKPHNRNIIDNKWVFTIKSDEYGNPLKYKARLVARGFSQEYLVDYNETFAPVARISSFRFILAFSNQFNLLVHHMDVKTAFLNGILKEEIYMKIPEGVKSKSNQVCKLHKALYGLKQAARCWFEMFELALKDKGFQNSSVDRCIYILDKGNIFRNIYVVLYVDDLIIATANAETMTSFKNYLMKKFRMVDLNQIKFFVGIKIERCKNRVTLDQSAYLKTVLSKFNMHECNPVSTPLPSKLNYVALNSNEKYDAPCRNLIGCLMYAMLCTRPDISIAVNILSRYMNKNNKELWQCLKRVLRYIKGSLDLKLTYIQGDYNDLLCGYVDSDWGSNEIDRKSTTGYLFKLFDRCTVSWNTKRQISVAASSTEAEYMALFEAVREALWLKSLATSININISEPITIYEDNNGCISIANNPTNHKRSKHIDIKYHFSREQIENNIIKLQYLPTGKQLADALTKPLAALKFQELRFEMGLE